MSGQQNFEPMERVAITLSNRIYQLMQAYAAEHGLSQSSIVETAVEEFLDIVESCGPEARAIARELSLTDE